MGSGSLRGIKKSGLKAAELYQTKSSYRRFDQKNNMIWQGDWNPEYEGLSTGKYVRRRKEMVEQGHEGYSVLDWAFLRGALANANASHFLINVPNHGGNQWSPLEIKAWGKLKNEPEIEPWTENRTEAVRIIKKMGCFFGADMVGICELDRRWVYSRYYDRKKEKSCPIRFSDESGFEEISRPAQMEDGTQVIPKEMKYAIVFIHEMDVRGIQTSPRLTHMATTMTAYSKIAYTTISMAEFIRGLGYNAIPSSNCTALNIPLVIDAGLGELGRNAKLINPFFGHRCRISKVITDLPLFSDAPVRFGVQDFCRVCKKCMKSCPANAIPDGKPSYQPAGNFSHQDVRQYQLDHAKCRDFWVKTGSNCGICITSCPYNKSNNPLHRSVVSFTALFPRFDRGVVFIDDLLGFGKNAKSEHFWGND